MATREQCIAILNDFDERFIDSVAATLFSLKTAYAKAFEISGNAEAESEYDYSAFEEAQADSVKNGTSDMTMDEIDAEIAAARKERRERERVDSFGWCMRI